MTIDNITPDNEKHSVPIISIILIVYNMEREAPRTLHTLTPEYQGIDSELYEVLVMDNGSNPPLGKQLVESMSDNFRYLYINNAPPSPSYALNKGAKEAKGKLFGFMIDGARMLSPGILKYTLRAYHAYEHPVVITLGFHLGSKFQQDAVLEGYDQESEDNLLRSVNWKENGYDLFKISCLAESSRNGWVGPISESNCIFIKDSDWRITNGFDEKFNLPGGGMCNLDFYHRVCTNKKLKPVIILGEGTFHQFHNGSMTDKRQKKQSLIINRQYSEIRNKNFKPPIVDYDYIGHLSDFSITILKKSIEQKNKLLRNRSFSKKIGTVIRTNLNLSIIQNIFRRVLGNHSK